MDSLQKEVIVGSHISQDSSSEIYLPISIFRSGASSLESISGYLKEIMGLRYCRIACLLNRDARTIWDAHHSAKTKCAEIEDSESQIKIPISIFHDRSLSVLEAIAEYLKDELKLRYCRIALLLNKDQRTVWTVYSRAKKKRKKNAR